MSNLKTIGVIGDVHCEHKSLLLAIDTLRELNMEKIICTGDLPTGPGDFNNCCNLLRKNQIQTVRGNHDRWLLSSTLVTLPFATAPGSVTKMSWRFLESLPVTFEFQTPYGLAQLCHGLGQYDMLSVQPGQSDAELDDNPILSELINSGQFRLIVNGHSHQRMVRHYKTLTIINVGTLRRDHAPCFATIDFEEGQVTFYDILNQQIVEQSSCLDLSPKD